MSIQSLRDQSEGIVAKIIIGLIIVVFALFGFGSITTFLAPVPKVAVVGGENITQQEMEVAVERNRRLLLAQGTSPADIDEDELRRSVLQNLINRKLLAMAADDLGLYYSDEGLDEEIVSTEAFQLDGVFSPQQFQLVIGGAGYTPMTYRAEMRTDKKLQQLVNGIQKSAFLTDPEVARMSALAQQTRDVAFLRIDTEDLLDRVEVSEAEMHSYYDSHPADFMTEETVDLAYVEVKREDLMDAVEVTEDALRSYFERTKDIYALDESRRIAHILIETNDDVTQEEAKARIDDIHQQLMDGASFEELAREYSEDPGSADAGGDLGFNEPGTFVEPFEEAAYDLDINQISEPVLTQFGYHIIKVLDIEAAREPTFAEVRDRVERAYRQEKAEELFVEKSGELSELAFESPDLEEPAAALDLVIKRTGPVTRDADEGLAANPDVMEAAFSPDVLLDGNNSRIIEITPNHHVVVRVADYQPQELEPYERVAGDVRDILAHEKATELAESQAQEIVAMLESGSITRYVADQFDLEWQVVADVGRNEVGLDPEINREAFKLPRPPKGNKSVGYTMLSDGDAAVITVTRVVNGPADQLAKSELEGLQTVLASQQGNYEYFEFRQGLAESADVEKVK